MNINAGNDSFSGTAYDDVIYGGLLRDGAEGGAGDDFVSGDLGSDTLDGDSGRDILFGGAGDDDLDGGMGRDSLWGGEGDDTFYFQLHYGKDVIKGDASCCQEMSVPPTASSG